MNVIDKKITQASINYIKFVVTFGKIDFENYISPQLYKLYSDDFDDNERKSLCSIELKICSNIDELYVILM